MNFVTKCIATGFFSGYMRPYPGTWGTIPAWLIAYFLVGGNHAVLVALLLLLFPISVWSSGEAEKELGHDARKIVIDEWLGMITALLFVPYSLSTYLIAFLAFRFFDVVKISPASQFERLPGGWGITMDDLIAGIQANVTTQAIVFVAAKFFDYSFI
jgi:phosphatidylglycerophosphatase A